MRRVPFDALDTIFLDAGNTIIGMDVELLADVLTCEGVTTGPTALGRAEAAARPIVSRHLAAGRSSEADGTFVVYVRAILVGLGRDDEALARRLVEIVRRDVPTQRLWSRVLPGVPAALDRLRASGYRLVVVSNSDGTVEQGLAAAGLGTRFDAVIDSQVVGSEKPDAGIFRAALAAVDADPARTLHVGDLYDVDVRGAWGAGVHGLLLDPFGDWPHVDCERVADLTALADRCDRVV